MMDGSAVMWMRQVRPMRIVTVSLLAMATTASAFSTGFVPSALPRGSSSCTVSPHSRTLIPVVPRGAREASVIMMAKKKVSIHLCYFFSCILYIH